jgi:hypothetical protein
MKIAQNHFAPSTALLRTLHRVDAQKTNRLCCAAAGITKAASASAEVRIPHKKLRRAANSDATLTARKRPLAQLVVRYEDLHPSGCKPISGPLYWPVDHRDCLPEEWFLLSPDNLSHMDGMLEAWLLPDAAQHHITDLLGRPFE